VAEHDTVSAGRAGHDRILVQRPLPTLASEARREAVALPTAPLPAPPPLQGHDEYDDPIAIEHFRQQLRMLRFANATGVLQVIHRTEGGVRRHQQAEFQDRLEEKGRRG